MWIKTSSNIVSETVEQYKLRRGQFENLHENGKFTNHCIISLLGTYAINNVTSTQIHAVGILSPDVARTSHYLVKIKRR